MKSDEPEAETPYSGLGPETVLDAVESVGYRCTGHQLALNSFENRVYQVGVEPESGDGGAIGFLVAKFYRAGRWSDAAILEEHRFSRELADLEIPVVAPLADGEGRTLHRYGAFRFSLYPRRGGRAPDLEVPDHLQQLGRCLARIHAAGAADRFVHRPLLDVDSFAVEPRRFLLAGGFVPMELERVYASLTEDLIRRARDCFARAGAVARIRLHGDCHPGNILWTGDGPHFVDFDDARSGPAVQDLWMCLSGERDDRAAQLAELLSGYQEFFDFDARELHLVEALRTLRIMHHVAWIAGRWRDPAFPLAFPWFEAPRFWDEHILSLREQAAMMDEPLLEWRG